MTSIESIIIQFMHTVSINVFYTMKVNLEFKWSFISSTTHVCHSRAIIYVINVTAYYSAKRVTNAYLLDGRERGLVPWYFNIYHGNLGAYVRELTLFVNQQPQHRSGETCFCFCLLLFPPSPFFFLLLERAAHVRPAPRSTES